MMGNSHNQMEAGKYLIYGLMAMRFKNLIKQPKTNLEEKDIEFFLRIIDFFQGAKDCKKAVKDFSYTALENYDKYNFCLNIMPKLFNIKTIKEIENLIDDFISDIKNTLDMNEIIPKGLEKETKFFRELQSNCISEHSKLTMGCW